MYQPNHCGWLEWQMMTAHMFPTVVLLIGVEGDWDKVTDGIVILSFGMAMQAGFVAAVGTFGLPCAQEHMGSHPHFRTATSPQ
jgi:hypothetical protein